MIRNPVSASLWLVLIATATMEGVRASGVPVAGLRHGTHIHGLAVDPLDPSLLLIATHHGLFRADPAGTAERISLVQDFMGFTVHPTQRGTLYASGHPVAGGNLGVVVSADNGVSWTQLSPGANGPVDFHQMTVSIADPQVLYGAFRTLQVSRDGGRNWSVAGALPENLIDLAASADSARILFAATQAGLLTSTDAGASWTATIEGSPVSLVEVSSDGTLYAFVVGLGLVKSSDGRGFKPLADRWDDSPLVHLALDPADPARMFAASQHGDILKSTDGGSNWIPFGS